MDKTQEHSLQSIAITIVLAVLVSLGGCRQIEESDNPISNTLTAVGVTPPHTQKGSSKQLDKIQFDDIPVPRGLRLPTLRNESFSYTSEGFRVGRMVYKGVVNATDVREHYLTTMPLEPYGWSRAANKDDSPNSLFFSKGGERCEIVLRAGAKAELIVTIVVETN